MEGRVSMLAKSFPSLSEAPGLEPWVPELLDAWGSRTSDERARMAVRFLLAVHNDQKAWRIGAFDAMDALRVWDEEHRRAFLRWAEQPWWGADLLAAIEELLDDDDLDDDDDDDVVAVAEEEAGAEVSADLPPSAPEPAPVELPVEALSTVAPSGQAPAPVEPSEPPLRQHPRFIAHDRVVLQAAGRDELKAQTHDISRGGLFIETDTPPPLRSHVQVRLSTPDGELDLDGEVVHVLEAEAAAAAGMPAGVGLQFLDMSDATRNALDDYLAGVSQRLANVVESQGGDTAVRQLGILTAQSFLNGVDAGDLYAALDVQTDAPPDHLVEARDLLEAALDPEVAGLTPPQKARIEKARQMLARVGAMLLDPARRLEHDLRHGVRPSVERFREARDAGVDEEKLRHAWSRAFPSELESAARYAAAAQQAAEAGDVAKALSVGTEALRHDPFNRELAAALETWRAASRA